MLVVALHAGIQVSPDFGELIYFVAGLVAIVGGEGQVINFFQVILGLCF